MKFTNGSVQALIPPEYSGMFERFFDMRFTYLRGKGFRFEVYPQTMTAVIMLIQLFT